MNVVAVRRQAVTHGLFNGLQQILEQEGFYHIAAKIDELHHDYQDLLEEEKNAGTD